VVTTAIQAVTKTGLLMADGSKLEADAIICATGFDTSFRPGFPVVAFGQDLREVWKEEPTAYMSIAAAKVPNYFSKSVQIVGTRDMFSLG
jgi:cation diffusion facilitator CzcD-associated flavoprotein CzcO